MSPKSRSGSVTSEDATLLDIDRNQQGQHTKQQQRKEILYNGQYYDVTHWVDLHPGGKVIDYYTESKEDATIAVQQFHARFPRRVNAMLKSFKKREPTETELAGIARHKELDADFKTLYNDLQREGYFNPSPVHIAYRVLEFLIFQTLGTYIIWKCGDSSWLAWAIGVVVFQIGSSRAGWLQHESGHYSLTGVPYMDRIISGLSMGLSIGLSPTWWASQHNRHHAMPQRMHRDVDLDTMPFMAFNAKVVDNPKQQLNFFVKYQAVLFLPLQTCLVGIFWKLYAHPRTAIYKRKWGDLCVMLAHYAIFLPTLGLPTYMLLHWIQFAYYFGNFTLSHTHLPVTNDSLHWVEYALNHTTNISPSLLCNWWMGYLNFQIEHHLFPTMPQFRHPHISHRVRQLANKHRIPYRSVPYFQAVETTFNNLIDVSSELVESAKSL